jgi:membrane dipeptidase
VTSLHQRLLTLDAHLDVPIHFTRADWSFADRHDHATDLAQVDLARMGDGALTGGFFVIYTDQGSLTSEAYTAARAHAFRRSAEIDAMLAQFDDRIGLARTADDAERLHAEGKLIAFKSIENSYPVGADLAVLTDFAAAGVRLAGPVHGRNNQLADSSTDTPRWGGLSPLGREWVAAMNRLGIVLDASHASDAAFDQMLELSATPIILSHSSPRAAYDHPRNIDDDRIRALAASGGAIGASTIFLSAFDCGPERRAAFDDLGRIGAMTGAEQAAVCARWRALDESAPLWTAGFDDYMAALLHAIDVAGVNHVCFGADFDGGGGLPGIEEVSALPRVTEALEARGFSASDIAKMWSGNLLRILRVAERHAATCG